MSLIVYIFDHVERSLAEIVQRLDKPNFRKMVEILAQEVQEAENVAWECIVDRALDTAIGAQLDQYGVIVGEDRDGMTDDNYRGFIGARILSNLSNGEPDRLMQILSIIGRASGPVRYAPLYPAAMTFDFESSTDPDVDTALRIVTQMTEVAPAGVEVAYIVQGPPGMFRLDTDDAGLDAGLLGRTL